MLGFPTGHVVDKDFVPAAITTPTRTGQCGGALKRGPEELTPVTEVLIPQFAAFRPSL